MTTGITDNFVQQFASNFYILGQQQKARLRPFCQDEGSITGNSKSVERMGSAEAYTIGARHGDTVLVDVPHTRRWLDLADKGWAELVDEMDKIKMLADPTSPYVRLGVAALNRAQDDAIIAAAIGNARAPSGNIALPAGQKIADGSTRMTLAKLLTAKEILDAAEVDDELDMDGQGSPQRVMVVTTKQLSDLLGTTEIKNVDYNNVKALAQGQVDTFLGFKFIRTERLPKATTIRSCIAWSRGCIAFGTGMDSKVSIDERVDKNYSVQVYARMSVGAVRVEDAGVVQIDCVE